MSDPRELPGERAPGESMASFIARRIGDDEIATLKAVANGEPVADEVSVGVLVFGGLLNGLWGGAQPSAVELSPLGQNVLAELQRA